MNKESYIKCSSANLHLLSLDLGYKKHLSASFPVEVFYILSGQAGLHKIGKSARKVAAGDYFEIVDGDEAEIISHSPLELLHLAFPYSLEGNGTVKNIARQICALQYFTRNKLSEISDTDSEDTSPSKPVQKYLNTPEDFDLSEPENVQKDSELLFKEILKNFLNSQRKKHDRS
ncbi:MAG: hypothetical protein NE327_21495 [Lentisphaeraceae bacterium]|nr:hypothetical protein [Lentisphaeraceae bacterium]